MIVGRYFDTAGTLCKAAEVLLENGAKEVALLTSPRRWMSGPAVERISNSVMKFAGHQLTASPPHRR